MGDGNALCSIVHIIQVGRRVVAFRSTVYEDIWVVPIQTGDIEQ